MALWVGVATALIVVLQSTPASADVRTEARAHFRRGMALIEEGHVDAGVAELELAYETLPHPNVLYNIASAYATAGRYEQALEYFERYLASEPPDTEEVRAIVQAIETRIAAAQPASAQVAAETTPEPEAAPTQGTGVEASEEEILALEEAANQIETLAEVSQSETLRMRAARLRALATELREGAAGGETVTEPTTTETQTSTGTTEAAAAGAPEAGMDIAGGAGAGDLYEETVVSASRFAQNPLDAPNSTTIITQQDIRLSGLTNIGELLRRAAGVQVMRLTNADVQVGVRGFNQIQSPRVLFLVNGRSTYLDSFGSTFLSTQPFNVEDIERIEVIRGPASALYGANGFSGVVNIVTKAPGDEPGTRTVVGIGNAAQVHGQLSTAGRQGNLGYRISGGYNQGNRFSYYFDPDRVDLHVPVRNPDRGLQTANINGSLEHRINQNVRTYAEGGINYGSWNFLGAVAMLDFYATGYQSHAMAGLTSGWGGIRAFWNRMAAHADLQAQTPLPMYIASDTIDVEGEFAREFHLLVDHNLHVGAAYRRKQATWELFPADIHENHYAGFIQDTMKLGERLILVAGLRVDKHPLLENLQVSPRGALIYRPTDEVAIRVSSGRAFRTLNFLESYILNVVPTPIPGVSGVGVGSYWRNRLFGGTPLAPEEIISTEAGVSISSDLYSLDANAYFNRVHDLVVQVSETSQFTLSQTILQDIAQFETETATYPFGAAGYETDPAEFTVIGGELMARVFPVRGLDIYANYAINKTYTRGNPLRTSEARTSLHAVNAGVQYRTTVGMDVAADVHYASPQVWPEQLAVTGESALALTNLPLPAYYMVNARLGWRFLDDDLELGVAGYNITNNQHRQHPFGQRLDARVLGTLAYRF